MKYIILILLVFGISIACTNDNKPGTAPLLGSDKDKYGCKMSAGETWSQLEQNCLRLSSQAIQLEPQSETIDATLLAFIFFRKDSSKVELFMPKVETSKVLEKSTEEAGTWQLNDLKLSTKQGKYTLELGDQLLYQSIEK